MDATNDDLSELTDSDDRIGRDPVLVGEAILARAKLVAQKIAAQVSRLVGRGVDAPPDPADGGTNPAPSASA